MSTAGMIIRRTSYACRNIQLKTSSWGSPSLLGRVPRNRVERLSGTSKDGVELLTSKPKHPSKASPGIVKPPLLPEGKAPSASSGFGTKLFSVTLLTAAVGGAAYYAWNTEKAKWGPGPVLPPKSDESVTSRSPEEDHSKVQLSGEAPPVLEEEAETQVTEESNKGLDSNEVGEKPVELTLPSLGGKVEDTAHDEEESDVDQEKPRVSEANLGNDEDTDGQKSDVLEETVVVEEKSSENDAQVEETPYEISSPPAEVGPTLGEATVAAMVADLAKNAADIIASGGDEETQSFSELAHEAAREAEAAAEDVASRVVEVAEKITPQFLTTLAHKEAAEEAKRKQESPNSDEGSGDGDEHETLADSGNPPGKPESKESKEGTAEKVTASLLYESVHEAMQRQAETDAKLFQEILEKLKREHSEEMKDARVEVLRHAQMAAHMEDELERAKAAYENALREQKRVSEDKRREEAKQQAKKAELEREEANLMTEANVVAAVAAEKAKTLQTLAEIDTQVKALREAFYTKSEESRKSHKAHKLAMCAFALEDALNSGAPLEREIAVLQKAVGGPGNDLLVDAVVKSLPPDVLKTGVPTRVQLQAQLEAIEPSIKMLTLMETNGGGILAHGLAKAVSLLKISENNPHLEGGGVEASLARVHSYLVSGDIVNAGEQLKEGVAGTKAIDLANEWANHARNRAIVEQGLTIIHAHASTLSASGS